MEAIASGLARTVLGNDAVNTDLAVETSADMEAIANRLGETVLEEGETVLEEGDKQSLANRQRKSRRIKRWRSRT